MIILIVVLFSMYIAQELLTVTQRLYHLTAAVHGAQKRLEEHTWFTHSTVLLRDWFKKHERELQFLENGHQIELTLATTPTCYIIVKRKDALRLNIGYRRSAHNPYEPLMTVSKKDNGWQLDEYHL